MPASSGDRGNLQPPQPAGATVADMGQIPLDERMRPFHTESMLTGCLVGFLVFQLLYYRKIQFPPQVFTGRKPTEDFR